MQLMKMATWLIIATFIITTFSVIYSPYKTQNISEQASCVKNQDYSGSSNQIRRPAQTCAEIKDSSLSTNNNLKKLTKILVTENTIVAPTVTAQDIPIEAAPDRRALVDLNDVKQKPFDSIGVITAENYDWLGSGFLISKCHVLTSNHVVFDIMTSEKAILGKIVKFGTGQTKAKPWKKSFVNGKIIGFDEKARTLNDKGEVISIISKRDWAVLKLDKSADGSYLGENNRPLCVPKTEVKIEDALQMKVKTIGHPRNKFEQTGNLSLWQDPDCKITKKDHIGIWYTTCQLRPGMSGGPIVNYIPPSNDLPDGCWMPIGINSKNNGNNAGFTSVDETKVTFSNQITPLNDENIKKITEVIEKNPCD